jgi:hypothetical protein
MRNMIHARSQEHGSGDSATLAIRVDPDEPGVRVFALALLAGTKHHDIATHPCHKRQCRQRYPR